MAGKMLVCLGLFCCLLLACGGDKKGAAAPSPKPEAAQTGQAEQKETAAEPAGKEVEMKPEVKPVPVPEPTRSSDRPLVVFETSKGIIKIELRPDLTPATVKNFLDYVKEGFYDGLIFHRVVRGFVIQGGGYDPSLAERPTKATIKNEARTGLKNKRGTVSMARTPDRDSASSQFYVNLRDNMMLDYRGEDPNGWGYCAFGEVVEGMDVVDAIAAVPTGQRPNFPGADTPVETVSIIRAYIPENSVR